MSERILQFVLLSIDFTLGFQISPITNIIIATARYAMNSIAKPLEMSKITAIIAFIRPITMNLNFQAFIFPLPFINLIEIILKSYDQFIKLGSCAIDINSLLSNY
ncbi:MAG: hypothetical protein ACFFDX_04715 [Candidatus Odinarchaeota archaeon]